MPGTRAAAGAHLSGRRRPLRSLAALLVPADRRQSPSAGVLFAAGALAAATGLTFLVSPFAPNVSLGGLYLLAVLPVAAIFGLRYAIPISVLSMALYGWLFLPPTRTFSLQNWQTWVALALYVGTSIGVSQVAVAFRDRAVRAEQGEREAAFLAAVSGELLTGSVREQLPTIAARAAAALEVERAEIVLNGPPTEPQTAGWRPLLASGERVGWIALAGRNEPSPAVAARVLPALASLLAVGLKRERLEHELVEAEAVRRSDAMKTAILRAVSHDLRSPLTAIKAASAGLGSNAVELSPSEREAFVGLIRSEAERLDHLVGNLLDLSRLEAGAAERVPELWTLDDLVVGTLEALGADADRVDLALPDRLPPVEVDAAQIERALVNILDNALKFSPPSQPVDIRAEVRGDDVVIKVDDRGPGVSGDLERLFSPFQVGSVQLEGTGLGLGLAIAKGFAELNGGRIWVQRSQAGGASFALALPAAQAVPVG